LNRKAGATRRGVLAPLAIALALAPLCAQALTSDREQKMFIDGGALKVVQNTSNNQPSVSYITGGAKMVQGSMKAHGDEATIYQHASTAKDAQGNDVSGSVQRVILIGKSAQAHIEQKQDGGGLMTADSDKIDFNADTNVAELTGNVVVIQPGRGEFRGAHMTYNTNTGEMQSGDNSPDSRVHMIIEPKAKPAAAPAEKPADAKPATPETKPATPAATDQH
jgi:lipopolysaccharide export system protein LptA